MAIADLLKSVNPKAGKVLKELAENEIVSAGLKATFGKRKFFPENVPSSEITTLTYLLDNQRSRLHSM
jgi:hypothetical protein